MDVQACERCQRLFGKRFALCPVCGGVLAPWAEAREPWVTVAAARNAFDAEVVAGFLQEEGITSLVERHGVAMYPLPEVGLELYLVLVPPQRFSDAERLLAASDRGEAAITETPAVEELEGSDG